MDSIVILLAGLYDASCERLIARKSAVVKAGQKRMRSGCKGTDKLMKLLATFLLSHSQQVNLEWQEHAGYPVPLNHRLGQFAPLMGPTAVEMEGIPNFRQVSYSLPGIYRSACLEQATAADAAKILDAARIRTIIDLRNDVEIEIARNTSTFFGRALLKAFDEGSAVGPGKVALEGRGVLRRVHVPVVRDVDRFFDEVAELISPMSSMKYKALCALNNQGADEVVYNEISSGKQDILHSVMFEITEVLWCQALQAVMQARVNGAVLFLSSQGKDRTGLLAALLQHAAGDPSKFIIEQYSASERLLQLADVPDKIDTGNGMDWRAWRGSPPKAMEKTLKWLRRFDLGLVTIGCERDWRERLLKYVRIPA